MVIAVGIDKAENRPAIVGRTFFWRRCDASRDFEKMNCLYILHRLVKLIDIECYDPGRPERLPKSAGGMLLSGKAEGLKPKEEDVSFPSWLRDSLFLTTCTRDIHRTIGDISSSAFKTRG